MGRKIEEAASVQIVDWNEETTPPGIPRYLADLSSYSLTNPDEMSPKTTLVTGATGVFSKALMPRLTARDDVDLVHCVGVSDSEKLLSHEKIVVHEGDLSMSLLGLDEREFAMLAKQIDIVLHMGMAHSFSDRYNDLPLSYVSTTKELVKLAAPRRVPIHCISLASVTDGSGNYASSDAGSVPPIDVTDGRTVIQWASERVLEGSAAEMGIPASIYSFPLTGEQRPAAKEVLGEFVRLVGVTHATPDATGWRGGLHVIPARLSSINCVKACFSHA